MRRANWYAQTISIEILKKKIIGFFTALKKKCSKTHRHGPSRFKAKNNLNGTAKKCNFLMEKPYFFALE
jgi:hypothetical protein